MTLCAFASNLAFVQQTLPVNVALHTRILQTGIKKVALAQMAGMTPWRFSRVLHGVCEPTKEEKRLLAKALGTSVRALFPEPEAVSA